MCPTCSKALRLCRYLKYRAAVNGMSAFGQKPTYAWATRSRLYEGQQVGIDGVGIRCRHAMREALVGLQRPVLQQFCRQRSSVSVGNDLIVVAMHHKDRHANLLEILREVGL